MKDKEKDELRQALLHYATAEASGGIKSLIDCEGCAFYLYENLGYRKLPDGAVVLLIGENNQALDEKTIEYFVKHNEQIRKEAVKEFAEKLWNTIKDKGIDYKIGLRALGEEIDELLKEYVK